MPKINHLLARFDCCGNYNIIYQNRDWFPSPFINALKSKQKLKDGSNLTVCSEVLYVRVYVAYTINSQWNGIKCRCF